MSLTTPDNQLRKLQEALYASAKQRKDRRFHQLYDKLYRGDVLGQAYAQARSNAGAPGVDNQTFRDIKEYGEEKWLQELEEELRVGRYRAQPVRRVMIPKASRAAGWTGLSMTGSGTSCGGGTKSKAAAP